MKTATSAFTPQFPGSQVRLFGSQDQFPSTAWPLLTQGLPAAWMESIPDVQPQDQPFSSPPTTDSPPRLCRPAFILFVTSWQRAAWHLCRSSGGHGAVTCPWSTLVMPELCSSPPWPGRKKGLAKGWPCLPPLRSSLGNTSGSSRSAQTNVSSTAGASGRGREGKKQEGNRQAVTRESVGTRRDALHYDLSAFSSPSSTSLPDPPRDLQLGERHLMNLCVHTEREAPPPKVSCCLSQQERPQ